MAEIGMLVLPRMNSFRRSSTNIGCFKRYVWSLENYIAIAFYCKLILMGNTKIFITSKKAGSDQMTSGTAVNLSPYEGDGYGKFWNL